MTKRILIAPNSFKECADAVTIADYIKNNLAGLKKTELVVKPISDGGDGFLNVCHYFFGGERRKYLISTAYNDSLFECPMLYCEYREEVYIETAEVLGLKSVPMSHRNPLMLSSKGLGELIRRIEEDVHSGRIRVKRVYIGIGGTATIDMGMGMMSNLGLSLHDINDKQLNVLPNNYEKVRKIKYIPFNLSFEIIPVVDVSNSLLGKYSGIKVFGNQKGADNKTILSIEQGFNNLLNLLKNNGLRISSENLSGAGGGIPAAFQIFYNYQLLPAKEFILYNLDLNKYINVQPIDYIITAEGSYDVQSEFGKGAGIIVNSFNTRVKCVFLICGKISENSLSILPKNVITFSLIKYFDSEADSILQYEQGIEKACQQIINRIDF
jgi:glycerate 2-kinase